MTRAAMILLAGLAAAAASAEEAAVTAADATVVATRVIRSQTVLGPDDVAVTAGATPGAYGAAEEVLGLEARVSLYAGRPVMRGDLGPPALLDRNQLVTMTYARGGLTIVAEGRALGRAGMGERVRVLNLDSKTVVTGRVTGFGEVEVGR